MSDHIEYFLPRFTVAREPANDDARREIQESLDKHVAEFLARGGEIQQIPYGQSISLKLRAERGRGGKPRWRNDGENTFNQGPREKEGSTNNCAIMKMAAE